MDEHTAKKLFWSITPTIAGVVASHPMLTIKVNKQVVGGNPKSLYSGMGWYLVKSVPAGTISFMLLQADWVQNLSPWAQGASTRLIAEGLVYPFSLWSQRKQVGMERGGYYRGISATLGRDLVFSTVFLQIHRGWLGEEVLLPLRIIAASTGASLATQPLDWLKVRSQLGMQMRGISSGLVWRLAYCNVRSLVAWSMFELLRP